MGEPRFVATAGSLVLPRLPAGLQIKPAKVYMKRDSWDFFRPLIVIGIWMLIAWINETASYVYMGGVFGYLLGKQRGLETGKEDVRTLFRRWEKMETGQDETWNAIMETNDKERRQRQSK